MLREKLRFFRNFLLTLLLVSVIVGIPSALMINAFSIANLIHCAIHPSCSGATILFDLKRTVGDGDDISALVLARKYEKWERKYVKKYEENRNEFNYLDLYFVAYELAGSYDKALEWQKARERIPYPQKYSHTEPRKVSLNFGVGGRLGTARIHYKMGRRRQAFGEYCEEFKTKDSETFAAKTERDLSGLVSLITLKYVNNYGELEWYHSLSCFDYDEFLSFMDEEYEKLGRPPEYEYTMKYFHAIGEAAREAEQKK